MDGIVDGVVALLFSTCYSHAVDTSHSNFPTRSRLAQSLLLFIKSKSFTLPRWEILLLFLLNAISCTQRKQICPALNGKTLSDYLPHKFPHGLWRGKDAGVVPIFLQLMLQEMNTWISICYTGCEVIGSTIPTTHVMNEYWSPQHKLFGVTDSRPIYMVA